MSIVNNEVLGKQISDKINNLSDNNTTNYIIKNMGVTSLQNEIKKYDIAESEK